MAKKNRKKDNFRFSVSGDRTDFNGNVRNGFVESIDRDGLPDPIITQKGAAGRFSALPAATTIPQTSENANNFRFSVSGDGTDLQGQFVYAALLDLGQTEKYIATIKLDDTAADKRVLFKDISIKKGSLYAGQTQNSTSANATLPADPDITIQQLVDFVKSDFAGSPFFSEKIPQKGNFRFSVSGDGTDFNGNVRNGTELNGQKLDEDYFAALERGDLQAAEAMVNNLYRICWRQQSKKKTPEKLQYLGQTKKLLQNSRYGASNWPNGVVLKLSVI